jgi:hypothetical protein
VYSDRLSSTADVARFRGLAAAVAKKKFPAASLGAFFGERPDPLLFSHEAGGGGGGGGGD